MFALMTLVALAVVGTVLFVGIFIVATVFKAVLHVALLPLKLLFLPFILIAIVVKLAIVLTVGAVVLALLIPLLVIGLLIGLPLMLVSALT